MNSLTLFIYFVGISDGIKTLLILSACLWLAWCAINWLARFIIACEDRECSKHARYTEDRKKEYEQTARKHRKNSMRFIGIAPWITVVLGLMVAAIPSERTLYMMAGSEVGESVLETEEMRKVRVILNDKLDEFMPDPDEED